MERNGDVRCGIAMMMMTMKAQSVFSDRFAYLGAEFSMIS